MFSWLFFGLLTLQGLCVGRIWKGGVQMLGPRSARLNTYFFVSLLGVWTCFSLAKLEACCAIKGTREGLCFSMYHDENEAC